MKKLLLILVLSITGATTYAQKSGDFEFGGNLGVNFSNLQVSSGGINNLSTDYTTSFNIAATGEYYFSDRWGIKGKLIFDQKGWGNGFFESSNGSRVITDYKLSYLTLPLMANWHFGSERNWYINFGLYLGLLLDAETLDVKTNLPLIDAFNSTDVGLALGIGYKFPVNESTNLFFELDGQAGFTSVFKEATTSSRNNRSALNFGVLFSL